MVIVVTGGIGSGKSQVCRIIADRYGFPVYSADLRVRQLYVEFPELLDALETSLNCALRNDEGTFQPSVLAGKIFSDNSALKTVESVVFPYLSADFAAFMQRNPGHVVFESATVLEKDFFADFGDAVILVDAPVELRVDRACRRDGADRQRVMARVDAQPLMNAVSDGSVNDCPEDSTFAKAFARVDKVILNDGTMYKLEEAVISAVDDMLI